MTAGLFSPMPPAPTGVADYAAALARALRPLAEVRVNPPRCDVALYHIGNNPLHREIYRRALAQPGVVVLHDAVLQHFFLGWLDEAAYVEEFVYNYGDWYRGLAVELYRGRARSASDQRYFRYPMLRRLAESARGVIVHNPAAARMVREHVAGARVFEIPHLYLGPAPEPGPAPVHGPGEFVFGVFGHLRESKRLFTVLRARARLPGVRMLVAGRIASEPLARALEPLLQAPGVGRVGYLEEGEFRRVAQSVDACINLRYPSAGETSGVTIRLMGAAKPVLLSEGEENSGYPEAACLRVDPGPAEEEMLSEYMRWLARFPDAGREIGRRAAAHIRQNHSPERVARLYYEVLRQCRA